MLQSRFTVLAIAKARELLMFPSEVLQGTYKELINTGIKN